MGRAERRAEEIAGRAGFYIISTPEEVAALIAQYKNLPINFVDVTDEPAVVNGGYRAGVNTKPGAIGIMPADLPLEVGRIYKMRVILTQRSREDEIFTAEDMTATLVFVANTQSGDNATRYLVQKLLRQVQLTFWTDTTRTVRAVIDKTVQVFLVKFDPNNQMVPIRSSLIYTNTGLDSDINVSFADKVIPEGWEVQVIVTQAVVNAAIFDSQVYTDIGSGGR